MTTTLEEVLASIEDTIELAEKLPPEQLYTGGRPLSPTTRLLEVSDYLHKAIRTRNRAKAPSHSGGRQMTPKEQELYDRMIAEGQLPEVG